MRVEQRARRSSWAVVFAALLLLAVGCRDAVDPVRAEPAGASIERPPSPTPEPAATAAPADALATVAATPTVTAARPEAPNIIVFTTDDQTVSQMEALPATQAAVFDAGTSFTQSFVNLPSCCPSRATFLTGQHARNHGVLTNNGVNGGFASFTGQETTFPNALQNAGYETVFVGKYLNGFGATEDLRYTPPGWSDFRGLLTPTEVLYHSPSFWIDDAVVSYSADDYTTDVVHDLALDALGDAVASGLPVFAWISYSAPHAQSGAPFGGSLLEMLEEQLESSADLFLRPPVAAAEDSGSRASERATRSPSFNEEDIDDKPGHLARRTRSGDQLEAVDEFHVAALESLASVDRSVAALAAQMERASPERPTWVIFTSDNGLLLGEHRHFGTKYLPYEEALRVPLGVSGPGVHAGRRSSAVVSNVDLAPTILDIADAEGLRLSDGQSLLPILLGEADPGGRAILVEGYDFRPGAGSYEGVHTGDSVYIEWLNGSTELYDLVVDPWQLDNLAGRPDAAELESRNEALLRRLETCAGSACADVGSDLPEPAHPARDGQ